MNTIRALFLVALLGAPSLASANCETPSQVCQSAYSWGFRQGRGGFLTGFSTGTMGGLWLNMKPAEATISNYSLAAVGSVTILNAPSSQLDLRVGGTNYFQATGSNLNTFVRLRP